MSRTESEWSGPEVEEGLDLAAQLAAVKRRRWPMLITFVVVLVIAASVAMFWPPTYRSMGTILIEQQEIPLDFVRSAVTSFADERVEIISQRVMTSSNLGAIIDRYGLYADQRDTYTQEELVERMREAVQREMISADVVDPRAGSAKQATIAFAVGFEYRSPDVAARVANDLVSLYLEKNIETRKQMAAGTTQFLTEETERLRQKIADLEQKVAVFKQTNFERLPQFAQSNIDALSRTSDELRQVDVRAQSLGEQIAFLQSQLAQLDPSVQAVTETGERIMAPGDRVRSLRVRYLSQLTIYTPRHPSMSALRQELSSLELQVGGGNAANAALDEVEATYTKLASARASGASPTEIEPLEQRIADLGTKIKDMPVRNAAGVEGSEAARNPAYVALQSQIQTANAERTALLSRRGELSRRIAELERSQALAPQVEREYSAMMRDLQSEQAKFAEVRQKLLDAQLSQNLESEQRGERFTLIEPPTQPSGPIRPNRPAIFALGALFALAASLGIMVLLELLDSSIRGRRQVERLLGAPPIAIIPWVAKEESRTTPRFWHRWRPAFVARAS